LVLANEYTPKVLSFYQWFFQEFERQRFWAVIDFRRCWEHKMALSAAQEWGLVLRIYLNTKKPINPYKYLDRYLTPAQLATAQSYPKHSREQVDYIISIVDERGACTDEIRELAYKLFRRKSFTEKLKTFSIRFRDSFITLTS